MKKILILSAAVLFLGLGVSPGWAEELPGLVILPFEINASNQDMDFLQKGIGSMLNARLGGDGNFHVIDCQKAVKGKTTPDSAKKDIFTMARAAGADFILQGSVTLFGGSVSTEARFMDAKTGAVLVGFNKIGKQKDDVFKHIKLLAASIQERMKEEKAGSREKMEGKLPGLAMEAKNLPGKKVNAGYWRSRELPFVINSIALGDVGGNGKTQVVVAGSQKIVVYQYLNKKLEKTGEAECPTYNRIISVDTADINGNGEAEIFVTCLRTTTRRLVSYVMEKSGKGLVKIQDEMPWYFRVIHSEGGRRILLGQKSGMKEPFYGGVFRMVWDNGSYKPGAKLPLPRKLNVFSFSQGDLTGDGRVETAVFMENDHIVVLDEKGLKEKWSSSSAYGGNPVFLEFQGEYDSTDKTPAHYYLPQRIHMVDFNRDGREDIVFADNKEMAGRAFGRFRSYETGAMVCLSWQGMGFDEIWKSSNAPGYISDSAIGDLDGDGADEIVFSTVVKEGLIFKSNKSYLISKSF